MLYKKHNFKDKEVLYAESLNDIEEGISNKATTYIQKTMPEASQEGDLWYCEDENKKTIIYIKKDNEWTKINIVPNFTEENCGQVLAVSQDGLTWTEGQLPFQRGQNFNSIRHINSKIEDNFPGGYTLGQNAVAEGLETIASGDNQHVQGKYNLEDSNKSFIIGNGNSENLRSNCMTVDWKGQAWLSSDILLGGKNADDPDAISLATYIATNGQSSGGGDIVFPGDGEIIFPDEGEGNPDEGEDNPDGPTIIYTDKGAPIVATNKLPEAIEKNFKKGKFYNLMPDGELYYINKKNKDEYNLQTIGGDNNLPLTLGISSNNSIRHILAPEETEDYTLGENAFALGPDCYASGRESYAQGQFNVASSWGSHAEGIGNIASGPAGHAEGNNTVAQGVNTHAEGAWSHAEGDNAHAEGQDVHAVGSSSHGEGFLSRVEGDYAHVEGQGNYVIGRASHAEGMLNNVLGQCSHMEGQGIPQYNCSPWDGGNFSSSINYNFVYDQDKAMYIYKHNYTTLYSLYFAKGEILQCYDTIRYNNEYTVIITDFIELDNDTIGIKFHNIQDKDNNYSSLPDKITFTIKGIAGCLDGQYNHIEGVLNGTSRDSNASHVEGRYNRVFSQYSHTEGEGHISYGDYSHIEGKYSIPDQKNKYMHISGNGIYDVQQNSIYRSNAHTLDWNGKAWFADDVVIGGTSQDDAPISLKALANGGSSGGTSIDLPLLKGSADGSIRHINSLPEDEDYIMGLNAIALGEYNKASGENAFSEGYYTDASGNYSHAEGAYTIAYGYCSHAEGESAYPIGDYSHAEGFQTSANGTKSHAEGERANATGYCSHAEGYKVKASGAYSHAEGKETNATGTCSHAEGGEKSEAIGNCSHAEGEYTTASGDYSHAEGECTSASGDYSHAEGDSTKASGQSSHSEGQQTIASEYCSHAEGHSTEASGQSSHAEGEYTTASGDYSHAEGRQTEVSGDYSHAEGEGTIASGKNQHTEGKYNIKDTQDKYLHIVGNGNNYQNRSNAHTLDWNGNAWFAEDVLIGGTSQDNAPISLKALATNSVQAMDISTQSDQNNNGFQIVSQLPALTQENYQLSKFYLYNNIIYYIGRENENYIWMKIPSIKA